MAKIGFRIKARREALGMSQDELALKMGYKNRSTIAKIENGTNDVVQTNIVKFAEVLNTTIAYLMDWEEEQKNKPTNEGELSEGQRKLYEFCSTVPDDKVDLILRVMKSIVEGD
jgi:transcriptional regulator with XRE-family HTH domain